MAHLQQPDTQPLPSELHEKHVGVRAWHRWTWPALTVGVLALIATSAALWPKPQQTDNPRPVVQPINDPDANWHDNVDTLLNELDNDIQQLDNQTQEVL